MNLKLFSSGYIEKLKADAINGDCSIYYEDSFPFNPEFTFDNTDIHVSETPNLINPTSRDNLFNFENGKIIYEAYKNLNPVHATDSRIWTYMAHVTFWDYMKSRLKLSNAAAENVGQYILKHYFVEKIQQRYLLDNHIASLWWVCHETYDTHREDPYELTKEAFSMADYTRDVIGSSLGLYKNFLHAFLETVIENPQIFEKYKEGKKRLLMAKMNYFAGYSIVSSMSKSEIKNKLKSFIPDLESVTS
jgi:hypothetical protein